MHVYKPRKQQIWNHGNREWNSNWGFTVCCAIYTVTLENRGTGVFTSRNFTSRTLHLKKFLCRGRISVRVGLGIVSEHL